MRTDRTHRTFHGKVASTLCDPIGTLKLPCCQCLLYVEALREYLSWEREEAPQLERSLAEADRDESVSLEEANEETRALLARPGIGPERLAHIRAEVAAEAESQAATS